MVAAVPPLLFDLFAAELRRQPATRHLRRRLTSTPGSPLCCRQAAEEDMNMDIIVVADIAIGVLFTSTVGFAIAWARTRERALRAELAQRMMPSTAEKQLGQLQESMEAISLELERIGEAERFTVRLLAERVPASGGMPTPTARREPGTTTPH